MRDMIPKEGRLRPVKSIPRPIQKSLPVLEKFLASGTRIAKLELTWSGNSMYATLSNYAAKLRKSVNRNSLPIQVMVRDWEIYLVKIDADIARIGAKR